MKTWVCLSGRVSSGLERGVLTIEHMTIRRMEHVGIVVDDLAVELFVALGLELQGEGCVEGRSMGRRGARARTGGGCADANRRTRATTGTRQPIPRAIRHIAFAVEDIDAAVSRLRAGGAELVGELERDEDGYRVCYVRGPEGIIVELARADGLTGTKRERG